jgi:DHA1 family multidrug/chloramphenicol efflux transport protein-like MFS transporter
VKSPMTAAKPAGKTSPARSSGTGPLPADGASIARTGIDLHILFFLVGLALFEASVCMSSDMAMPAMYQIASEFEVGFEWIPHTGTAFLAGSVIFGWIAGPLGGRFGSIRILMVGVSGFIAASLALAYAHSALEYTILRTMQGAGMAFVGTVGYATLHDVLSDRAAVRAIAIMTPLKQCSIAFAPLAGAALFAMSGWRVVPLTLAMLAAMSIPIFLFAAHKVNLPRVDCCDIADIFAQYRRILASPRFYLTSLSTALLCMPQIAWIAASPHLLMTGNHVLSARNLSLCLFPGSLSWMVSSLCVARFVGRFDARDWLLFGSPLVLGGLILASTGAVVPSFRYHAYITGMSVYAMGVGLCYPSLIRLALSSCAQPKGLISAMYMTFSRVVQIVCVEGCALLLHRYGSFTFFCSLVASALVLSAVVVQITGTSKKRRVYHCISMLKELPSKLRGQSYL